MLLSIEMNLAKNGLNQKAFIKERGTELFKDCQQRKEIHCSVGKREFIAPVPIEKIEH